MPAWDEDSKELYCLGTNYSDDDTITSVSTNDFAKICEAITEYNSTNGKGYKKWPEYGDNYYTVNMAGSITVFRFENDDFDIRIKNLGQLL